MIIRLLEKLLGLFNIRLLGTQHPGRIGHVAMETMCFCKENSLRQDGKKIGVHFIDRTQTANSEFLRIIKQNRTDGLILVTHPVCVRIYEWLRRRGIDAHDLSSYSVALEEAAPYYAIERDWEAAGGGPFLKFSKKDESRGAEGLSKLGIPPGAWYVCFHCRTEGYAPEDDNIHTYRNADIDTYVPAMKAIVAKGGWCLRMGDPAMPELEPIDGVVDYAHSEHRTPFMDVYLTGSCRFFVGNTSGLILVANAFGRKLLWTNLAPMGVYPSPGSFGICKLIYSEHLNRLLTFSEVMETPVSIFRFSFQFEDHDLRVIDNTSEEIEEAVMEIFDSTEPGKDSQQDSASEHETMQQRMLRYLHPRHYAHGTTGRFSASFLTRHRNLVKDEPDEGENFREYFFEVQNTVAAKRCETLKAKIRQVREKVADLRVRNSAAILPVFDEAFARDEQMQQLLKQELRSLRTERLELREKLQTAKTETKQSL